MFRENIIKNIKNYSPADILNLGFLVGKHCCFLTHYFNNKKKRLSPQSSPTLCSVLHLANQGHLFVGEAATNGVVNDDTSPGVGSELAVLVPVEGVPQIGVVFFHEIDHPVVAEADLLELVVVEVVGLVLAFGVPAEVVEAGLGELLALATRPILHGPAEIGVALDAARRRPSALLLLLATPRH
jgi:hypothetical protein